MKWEYKAVKFSKLSFFSSSTDVRKLEEMLNTNGEQNWELVSCNLGSTSGIWKGPLIAIFKKPKDSSA